MREKYSRSGDNAKMKAFTFLRNEYDLTDNSRTPTGKQKFTVHKSTPNFGAKKFFFLFLWKNFLEKLLFYRRISFQIRYGFMKKTTASLDVKFTISLT